MPDLTITITAAQDARVAAAIGDAAAVRAEIKKHIKELVQNHERIAALDVARDAIEDDHSTDDWE